MRSIFTRNPAERLPLTVAFAKWYWRYGPRRGRKLLANAICSRLPRDAETTVLLQPGGVKAIIGLSDPMSMYPLAYGEMPEKCYAALIGKYLQPGNIFIDVGASFGYYTLTNADAVKHGGRIICFEPQPSIAKRLQRSVLLNGFEHVTVQQIAIGSAAGTIRLHCPINHMSGIATVCCENPQIPKMPHISMDVPVAPLDEILPRLGVDRVDAIKIDVESYELEVLRGASSLLSSQEALVLFMEILSWAEQGSDQQDGILRLLWSFDYLVYRIDCDEATLIRSTNQLLHEQNVCALKPKLHPRMNEMLAK